ncbi:Manganese homeostasis protein [Komagataella phaffii CBS 7435]|uniref:Golgi membrane protein involved in manganese homeostasis n=2 Tax=Komagataella phaffii TaxID=460519 RepID=C4R8T6_KOMPG|nr:Golgi membrane protein involved in manganese homeostasis [Komagataella phaffii GS115]AOA65183.1 GQ67_05130T0 [Komagataella phaffii]CAH2450583.1 Manganese homeostasis protein [Komagataella phaffii CBS 7435]AOA69924.1 GQ68_05112T0 [Komagataella phaffii GS115]CAY72011.1 Golgi membrane protein involved in manganese homeostasis [Komagataella phaffii GS115]CCA40387.1 Manganese homeostasis protein [Komagataella phaffii CBS 7435]
MLNIATLLVFSFLMGISSFGSGLLPLYLNLNEMHISLVSALGTGIIISSALTIVLEEGLSTLQSSGSDLSMFGPYILFGFIAMYLFDNLGKAFRYQNLSLDTGIQDRDVNEHIYPESSQWSNLFTSVLRTSTTLGLCIHSLTDGIALASSILTRNMRIGVIIFFIVAIHKLPSAFALTSILLREGLPKDLIYKHVGLFSLSAPSGAILTYIIARLLNLSDLPYYTGALLLFSGGTFLYVGFHSLMTITDNRGRISKLELGLSILGMVLPLVFSLLRE